MIASGVALYKGLRKRPLTSSSENGRTADEHSSSGLGSDTSRTAGYSSGSQPGRGSASTVSFSGGTSSSTHHVRAAHVCATHGCATHVCAGHGCSAGLGWSKQEVSQSRGTVLVHPEEEDNQAIGWIINYVVETATEEELIETIGRGYYSYVAGAIASRRVSEERTREMEEMCVYCVRMLRSCDYVMGDLLCLFAVAASSLRNVFCHLNNPEPSEVLHIALAQVFLAHCWLFDEACPIKEWHTHIFRPYCSHACLNGAVMKLFSIQGWRFSAPSALVRNNLLNLLPRKLTLKMIDHKPSQLYLKPN